MSTYEISKSSLLSLKAEILRKQDELSKVKVQNNINIAQHVKKNTPLDIKNKGIEKRMVNEIVEDEDLLRKSRDALEAKSRLYDKLSKGKILDDDDELNKRYLVQFNKKQKDLHERCYSESEDEEQICEDNYEPALNSDEEWVEYTDCLGRTRKCLRKDLEHIKLNDAELKDRMEGKESCKTDTSERKDKKQVEEKEVKEDTYNESSELLSTDMRRELLRKQWEKEEEEIKNKTNVHYQDILFNEARMHGVGYYQFSKDEEKRKTQQEALKNLRKETEDQQKRAQELKLLREKQLKARIKAARNRKRARMELPPEEESDNEEPIPEPVPVIIPENLETMKEKEEARKNHVRPWDIGKKGVKEHYVHTQDEWVEKKRKERPTEFAPPIENKKYKEEKKLLFFTTKRYYSSDESDHEERKSINPYKSSRNTETSSSNNFKSTHIINELDSDSDEDILSDNRMTVEKASRKRAEIAPPTSYGSSTSKLPSKKPSGNIAESIDAGLKFLRMQSEKTKKSRSDDIFLD